MIRAVAKRPRTSTTHLRSSTTAVPSPYLRTNVNAAELARQHVTAALTAVMQAQPLLRAATSADIGGSSVTSSHHHHDDSRQHQQQRRSYRRGRHEPAPAATADRSSAASVSDSVHQTGTGYRSNNAGDGPEKTRDRKSWFPRFKSNWLGTYRSKQMFHCCECAVADAPGARYKGSEGKHCACGQDQWHLAKTIEEAEYNRRMEISKALGGLRYDEALERLKAMGTSEHDLKRLRCESDEASVASSCSSVDDHADAAALEHASKRIKSELALDRSAPLSSPATRAYGSSLQRKLSASSFGLEPVPTTGAALTAELLQKINTHHAYSGGLYTPLSGEYSSDHLMPAPFADEEGFGELLQGFLEDDPRGSYSSHYQQHYYYHHHHPSQYQQHHASGARLTPTASARPAPQYGGGYSTPLLLGSSSSSSEHPRYPQAPPTMPLPPHSDVDFEFFADGHSRAMVPPPGHSAAAAGASNGSGYYPPTNNNHYLPHPLHAQSPYARPHLAHPHGGPVMVASPQSFSIV